MSSTVSMSQSALEALIASKVAEAIAAQPKFAQSDFKIVITSGIPSPSGRTWATVEITDQRTGALTKTFVDRFVDGGKRKDGASQEVIYASEPKAKEAPVTPPAASTAPAAKATRKIMTAPMG